MRIIKRFVRQDNGFYCAVWTNTYAHSFSHIRMLVDVAREHELLSDNDIDVMKYGGDRYKGMMAVEFVTDVEPSGDWEETTMLEFTL